MTLFPERTEQCSSKELDTADIVREAIYHQQPHSFRFADNPEVIASWLESKPHG